MDNYIMALPIEDRLPIELSRLYEGFGYKKYCMAKFEEYSFYSDNRDFINGEGIIAFNNTDGRLMALKPDITLSIVKNSCANRNYLSRFYYNENVYRISKATKEYKEIKQTGLELLGTIDNYAIAEIILLAVKSLQRIDSKAVLVISHIQLVSSYLKELSLKESVIKAFEQCIKNKNLHDLFRIADQEDIDEELINPLKELIALNGTIQDVLPRLKDKLKGEEMNKAYEELRALCQILIDSGLENFINIDLSVINHLDYYNGIIFQGYVEKAPNMVLSGGRYDRLAERIGEGIGAIGFAVYIDGLNNCYPNKKTFDTEVLIINEDTENTAVLLEEVERLASENYSVRVEKRAPEAHTAARVYVFLEGKLKEVTLC